MQLWITLQICYASKVGNHSWTGSVQGAVANWSAIRIRLRWFDQVATAPCTDPIQVRFLTLAKPSTLNEKNYSAFRRLLSGNGCFLSLSKSFLPDGKLAGSSDQGTVNSVLHLDGPTAAVGAVFRWTE